MVDQKVHTEFKPNPDGAYAHLYVNDQKTGIYYFTVEFEDSKAVDNPSYLSAEFFKDCDWKRVKANALMLKNMIEQGEIKVEDWKDWTEFEHTFFKITEVQALPEFGTFDRLNVILRCDSSSPFTSAESQKKEIESITGKEEFIQWVTRIVNGKISSTVAIKFHEKGYTLGFI